MRVAATSDLHGFLPQVPECDLLLIAGDVCPVQNHRPAFQAHWLYTKFADWLDSVPAKRIVGCWGNHDLIAEKMPAVADDLRWDVLKDESIEVDGLTIYGIPWTLRFCDWAFNLDEPELDEKFFAIRKADIIVSHGPPLGYGDLVERGERVGSPGFLKAIDRLSPGLAVFGHIHEGSGQWLRDKTRLANVTLVDAQYRPVNPILEIEL